MKQQYNMTCEENLEKKPEAQMGFEPTTLHDLVGCSNLWATGDSMVSKGSMIETKRLKVKLVA